MIVQVVKDDYAKPYGTWLKVTPAHYKQWGPHGTGHLKKPSRKRDDIEVVDLTDIASEGAIAKAAEEGIDISEVQGSGPGGKVYKKDL